MPSKVMRYLVDSSSGSELALISVTTTDYCDAMPGTNASCTAQATGDDPSATTGTTRFVRPTTVSDTSFLLSSTTLANSGQGGSSDPSIQVSSTFEHDKQGNPITTTVTTEAGEDEYQKTIVNVYGASGSTEERLGKVTECITERKVFEKELLEQAFHDSLTGLIKEYQRKMHAN